jgi:hypothetical protein
MSLIVPTHSEVILNIFLCWYSEFMSHNNTNSEEYFEEIHSNTQAKWKRFLPLQVPYKLNLKMQSLGKVLEIGAGLGRNQGFLNSAVGVEHNIQSVQYCINKGFDVYLPEVFDEKFKDRRGKNAIFDSLLISHVLEHIEYENQIPTVLRYLPYLKASAKIMLITPQEAGHHATKSHITWTDFDRLEQIIFEASHEFKIIRKYSFPFSRSVGKLFMYNEFNVVAARK